MATDLGKEKASRLFSEGTAFDPTAYSEHLVREILIYQALRAGWTVEEAQNKTWCIKSKFACLLSVMESVAFAVVSRVSVCFSGSCPSWVWTGLKMGRKSSRTEVLMDTCLRMHGTGWPREQSAVSGQLLPFTSCECLSFVMKWQLQKFCSYIWNFTIRPVTTSNISIEKVVTHIFRNLNTSASKISTF